MDAIGRFEKGLLVFQAALTERFAHIVQMSGNKVSADFVETPFVIPGLLHNLKCDDTTFKVWIGANFHRLFFITRLAIEAEKAEEVFAFTFSAAKKIGWDINFEPVGDNEVSIWATVNAKAPILHHDELKEGLGAWSLTDEGAYWAVDIPMMMQSCIRTSERKEIKPSKFDPAPL